MFTVMTPKTEHGRSPDSRELDKLLAGIAAGSSDDTTALYECTRTSVYALALSIVKNTHDAQDVTQDTFVRVWENAPHYRPQGTPMAWILTIAKNEALMKLRQASRIHDLSEDQWAAIPADAPNVTPEDRHLLDSALGVLSDTERQIVLLHAVTGLRHREIGEVLGLPLATVLSKYHRALKKLRNFMKGDD